jgi:phospholipase/carboxylesterase
MTRLVIAVLQRLRHAAAGRSRVLVLGCCAVVSAACGSGGIGYCSGGIGSIGVGVERAEAGTPASEGHLLSRPTRVAPLPTSTGAQPLGLDGGRDGVLYVPPGLTGPAPLFVLLHGATGTAAGVARRLDAFPLADELKMVILAPDSRDRTWDAIRGQFGPDVAFLDKALAKVFAQVPIDPKRVAIGGFSDGASYAISLGLQNGDLFTHVVAFSPGFFVGKQRRGRPLLYVSHGQSDAILPIDTTSRRLVPALKRAGYDVRYHEFNGPHTVPASIARDALEWIAGGTKDDKATKR